MRLSLLARAASTAAWEDSSSSSDTTMPGSTTRSETNRTGSRVSDTDVSLSETLSDTDSTSAGGGVFRRAPVFVHSEIRPAAPSGVARTTYRSPATSTSNTASSSQAWVTGPSART